VDSANDNRTSTKGFGLLLAGSAALFGGLIGLEYDPLIGVLLVMGGMALAISAACELLREPAVQKAAQPPTDDLWTLPSNDQMPPR
jgi:hypothetical protein